MNSEAKILSGIAGEYFVAGELSRRGYIASITLKNTAHIDVLASNGEKAVNIQVKTSRIDKAKGWELGSKPLKFNKLKGDVFYVLVEIRSDPNNKEIGYYIIPQNTLNEHVEKGHLSWLQGKNKITGGERKSKRRYFRTKEHPTLNIEKYKDNWSILFN